MEKQRILIVDDEIRMCESLAFFLSSLDYEVRCFTKGRPALSYIQDHGCDLVLLDLVLPDIDGFIFLAQLKEKTPDIQVIIITAQNATEYVTKAIKEGADDYFCKPFEMNKLIARLQELLNAGHRPRRDNSADDKYRQFFENAAEGMYQSTPEGRFLNTNPAAARILGYDSPEELIGTITDIRSQVYACPEDRDRMITILKKDGVLKNFEMQNRRKNGSLVWISATAFAVCDEQGRILYYEGTFKDITDRKQTEQFLRESEELYRTVIETSPDPIIMYDLEGNILMANTQTAGIYGAAGIDEFLREVKTIFDLLTDEGKPVAAANFQRTLTAGASQKNEYSVRLRNGQTIVVEINSSTVKTATGEPRAFISVVRDISERKRTEKMLREAKQILDAHLENSPVAIVEFDPAFRITRWSGTAEKVFGWKADEVLGKAIGDLKWVYDDDRGLVHQVSDDMLWGSRPRNLSINRNYRKDGSIIHCEWYNSAIYDEHGQLTSIFSIVLDITEKKWAEEEKAKIEAEYRQRQKAESLGRMAGSIAHNFNNLLGVVLGNLELASLNLPLGSDLGKYLAAAMQAANRSAEVSHLMLTYLGQTFSQQEPLDLSEVCRRNIDRLRDTMPQEVHLEVDLPFPGPAVKADAHQMQQVLTNLATNAWEALDEVQGKIHLAVKTVLREDISSKNRFPLDWQPQDQVYACLAIADTGCGIPEADIEKLFDPFFTSKFTGRGLGLPVVLGIVREHGGAITVESETGSGSVLKVFLPLLAEAVPALPEQTIQAPEIAGGAMVLLIDDEQSVRKIAKNLLLCLGLTVLEAKDGAEAVVKLREHKDEIRFVLCDLIMPRMDGWETLAALRKLVPRIPFILSSGYDKA